MALWCQENLNPTQHCEELKKSEIWIYEAKAKLCQVYPCTLVCTFIRLWVFVSENIYVISVITMVCLLSFHPLHPTGERPFKCKLCSFASTTQSHLSRHKRVHTGEKPYRCPWCDYRYRLIDPPTVGGADGCHHGTDDQGVDRWGVGGAVGGV